MQAIIEVASNLMAREIKESNFFDENGKFEIKKVKDYFLSDQRRAGVLAIICIYLKNNLFLFNKIFYLRVVERNCFIHVSFNDIL